MKFLKRMASCAVTFEILCCDLTSFTIKSGIPVMTRMTCLNLEIQRKDIIDHARRTRFYAAMIDGECLEKGKDYNQMPDVYIIYISETDLWTSGKTLYNVEKKFKETEIPYDETIAV